MNRFFHEFQPKFVDTWCIVVIAGIVLSAVIGYALCVVKCRKGAFVCYRNNTIVEIASGIIAFVPAGVFMRQSICGIIQWFDNGLDGNTSSAWSVLGAMFVVMMFWCVCAALNYKAAIYAQNKKQNFLSEIGVTPVDGVIIAICKGILARKQRKYRGERPHSRRKASGKRAA